MLRGHASLHTRFVVPLSQRVSSGGRQALLRSPASQGQHLHSRPCASAPWPLPPACSRAPPADFTRLLMSLVVAVVYGVTFLNQGRLDPQGVGIDTIQNVGQAALFLKEKLSSLVLQLSAARHQLPWPPPGRGQPSLWECMCPQIHRINAPLKWRAPTFPSPTFQHARRSATTVDSCTALPPWLPPPTRMLQPRGCRAPCMCCARCKHALHAVRCR